MGEVKDRVIQYTYDYAPTLYHFSEDRHFIRGIMGPFGSGKSSACVMQAIELGYQQRPNASGVRRTRGVIVRNTYQQLRDTTIKTFHDWIPPGFFGSWNKSEHSYLITRLDPLPDGTTVEIEVIFRALDRPDQVGNLLSMELTWAWVNEAREVPWAIIEALQGRVGRFPSARDEGCTWFGIFMDTNPPDEDSWWFDLFEKKRPEDAMIFKQPGGLDPKAENMPFLPPNYYERLMRTMDEQSAKVYVLGQYGFLKDGRPVYAEYNDLVHCTLEAGLPRDNSVVTIYRGWDFGLTPACTFSCITPEGYWKIFDEMCATRAGIDTFSDEVLLHCGKEYQGFEYVDYGDPAGDSGVETDAKTCFQILRGKGVNILPGEQTLALRLESVRVPMRTLINGRPQLQVHPRCSTLRKGFAGRYQYRRMMTSEEKYTDTPDKNAYSHPHDSLQYVGTKLFGQLVKNQVDHHSEDDLEPEVV